ncbi:MAG: S8 family serine peptidase, partial [Methylococcales bacterium]
GKKTLLRRSLTEYTVLFDAKLPPEEMEDIIKTFSTSGKMISKNRDKRRILSQIKLITAKQPSEIETEIDTMQAQPEVVLASPAFIHPQTNTKLFLTDQIVIKLKPGHKLDVLFGLMSSYGMVMKEKMFGSGDEFVLEISDPKAVNALEAANAVFESGMVEWAEPNFVQDYKKMYYPNDPGLPYQWHLTGSTANGTPTAHVDALRAWDITLGSPNITIAVLDDGVQWNHPDLANNIFVNTKEIAGNRIDDDRNGLIDDVIGWDFANGDNNPSPYTAYDNHGTSVAGVAAASGNNGLGVSGACPRCKILPVKIANSNGVQFENFDDVRVAIAIRYAASYAAVLNNSWGGGAPSQIIQSAIRDASLYGRGGKGSVVLFASGNSA